jgi:hypothetical protein
MREALGTTTTQNQAYFGPRCIRFLLSKTTRTCQKKKTGAQSN